MAQCSLDFVVAGLDSQNVAFIERLADTLEPLSLSVIIAAAAATSSSDNATTQQQGNEEQLELVANLDRVTGIYIPSAAEQVAEGAGREGGFSHEQSIYKHTNVCIYIYIYFFPMSRNDGSPRFVRDGQCDDFGAKIPD